MKKTAILILVIVLIQLCGCNNFKSTKLIKTKVTANKTSVSFKIPKEWYYVQDNDLFLFAKDQKAFTRSELYMMINFIRAPEEIRSAQDYCDKIIKVNKNDSIVENLDYDAIFIKFKGKTPALDMNAFVCYDKKECLVTYARVFPTQTKDEDVIKIAKSISFK